MCVKIFCAIVIAGLGTAVAVGPGVKSAFAQTGSDAGAGAAQTGQPQTGQQGRGGREGRGMGMGFPGGGRGVLGTVTEATADHYTIKTDTGDVYAVHFSVNTRMMKQGAGRGQGGAGNGGGRRNGAGDGGEDGGNRPAPQTIKPTDIHVGDIITAGGEMDAANKSVGAVFIALVDPERAKQMREMQANYGKTWLAGRITAIHETTITIEGMIDHKLYPIVVDENTSFHQRRDSITLADIQPGEQLRAEGALKGNVFLATTVTAMQPREGGPGGQGPATGGAPQ